jgi:iron(III) transport system permease protein
MTLALFVLLWAGLAVFVLYPLARLLAAVFAVDGTASLGNLAKVFRTAYTRKALVNSLALAGAVGVSGTFFGYLFAFSVTRIPLPKLFRWFLKGVVVLPFVSPPFTSSIALTLALGPGGMLLRLFRVPDFNLYGFTGTWIAETLTYFPIAFLALSAILEAMDPNLEEASASLGSSRWRTFCTVTLPLSAPGIANAFLLLFGASLTDFATPLVMAGHTFPVLTTQAYLQITGMYDLRGGAALSFVLLLPALMVYLLQHSWVERRSQVTVTGRGGPRSAFRGAGRFGGILVLSAVSILTLFILFLYSIIFLGSFVKVWGVDHSLTIQNYAYVFTVGRKAVRDTVLIALTSTLFGTAVAASIGFLTARREVPFRKALGFVSLLNYILPGTVVGIAYVIAFNSGPLVLTGTMTILVALCVFRYDAVGIRSTAAALRQIDPSLEEASLSLGASRSATFFRILLPLAAPAVAAGARYLFVVSMTAISATIFLVSVRWSLLTVRILECVTELLFAQAAAFSVVLILIVFLASGAILLVLRLSVPRFSSDSGRS